jgi:CheY-like chemotaxis protein
LVKARHVLIVRFLQRMKHPPTQTILLVEPDADGRQMYTDYFAHHGFRVLSATTGRDALMLAPRVDAIVTEIRLAGELDAIEFMSELKQSAATSDIPLIVVTSRAWNTDRERAQRAGCDLFLSKPCLPSDLVRSVRRLIAGSRFRRLRGADLKHGRINGPAVGMHRHRRAPALNGSTGPEHRATASDHGRRGHKKSPS